MGGILAKKRKKNALSYKYTCTQLSNSFVDVA